MRRCEPLSSASVFAITPVMRVLFADKFPADHLDQLRQRGFACDLRPELTGDDLPGTIAGYDALVVRSTPVTAATLDAADRLQLVLRAGAGVNTIDVAGAAERGIYVANVPGKNAVAVAELAMGLLLAVDRNIPDNVADLRAGRWDKSRYQKAQGLLGRAVGVIGVGSIGLAFAERARAFGMKVHVVDKPDRSPDTLDRLAGLGAVGHPDLPSLVAACDVLSFHVPAGSATKGMIGRELLAHCRPGAIIVNTSRGDIVDEEALLEAIEDKGLRAGLDVYQNEPASGTGEFVSPLAKHPNVYGTHHIGASTEQAQEAVATEAVALLTGFAAGAVRNTVNLDTHLRGASTLVVRHYNRVGVLARVLHRLSSAGVNVEQMENRIFDGGQAAAATMQTSAPLDEAALAEIAGLDDVIGVSAELREEQP